MHDAIKESRRIHKKPNGFKLEKDDVWGAYDMENHERVKDGLVVARSDEPCPVFGDTVPYKSVTIVFDPAKFPYDEVIYWVIYVQGGEPSDEVALKNGKWAIRSDYQAW